MMVDDITTIEYAVRYCITRRSYAFVDGLDLAERWWEQMSDATRRDVITSLHQHGPIRDFTSDPTRWPKLHAARWGD